MRAQMSNDLAARLPRRPQKIFAPPRAFGSPRPAAPRLPQKIFFGLFCQKVDISAAKEYNSSNQVKAKRTRSKAGNLTTSAALKPLPIRRCIGCGLCLASAAIYPLAIAAHPERAHFAMN